MSVSLSNVFVGVSESLFSSLGVKLYRWVSYLWMLLHFPPQRLPVNSHRRTLAVWTMRVPTLLTPFGLLTCTVALMLPLLGSCHPASAKEEPRLVFMERVNRLGVRFDWKNVTCPLCKAVFTILDIALLVMNMFLKTTECLWLMHQQFGQRAWKITITEAATQGMSHTELPVCVSSNKVLTITICWIRF